MLKVAVLILAGTESHESLARLVNALEAARECHRAGDQVLLIFDGAATAWLPRLADPGERLHPLYRELRERVAGACAYCARAFGVEEAVRACGIPLLAESEGHPSLRRLLEEGYQVLSF
ncbi:MAG: hypothetical protein D6809_06050 [Gammaproteobacteria bacterium]|nr:MAG: hypothetical protein D6809_06050 [Gammaproteobacteria bacterium]